MALGSLVVLTVIAIGFMLRSNVLRRELVLGWLLLVLIATVVIAALVWSSMPDGDRDATRAVLEVLGTVTAATLLFAVIVESFQIQLQRKANEERSRRVEAIADLFRDDVAGPLYERAWHVLCDADLVPEHLWKTETSGTIAQWSLRIDERPEEVADAIVSALQQTFKLPPIFGRYVYRG